MIILRLIFISLIYLFSVTVLCCGQKIDNIRNTSWINVDYINQMLHNLPCQCADSINYCYYISIAADGFNSRLEPDEVSIPEIILHYVIEAEVRAGYIINSDTNKYVIAGDNEKWETKNYDLKMKEDTLLLIGDSAVLKFIQSELISTDFYSDDNFGFDNIRFFNMALSLRGFPTIQTILKEDSLSLYCNGWFGNLNMIHVKNKPKSWILEIIDGYLYIRKAGKKGDLGDNIKTKLFKVLKWDNNTTNLPNKERVKVYHTRQSVSLSGVKINYN